MGPPSPHRRRRARAAPQSAERALWPLAVLVALLVGLPVAGWLRSALRGDPPPIEVRSSVDAYRIVYLVEDLSGDGSALSTEIVTVRRPFEGRVEVRSGAPPGDETLSVVVSGFAREERRSGTDQAVVFVVEPGPPRGDVRVDATLTEADERGALTFTDERRTVAQRACAVYRILVLSPTGRDEDDSRRLCLDEAGLVLSEEYWTGDRVRRRRTAIKADVDPDLTADAFTITGRAVPIEDGGGALRELTPDSRVEDVTVHELPLAPEGFRHVGRFGITPTSPVGDTGIIPSGTRVVGVIDVWERGRDFVAVFNGGTDDQVDPFGNHPAARPVELGAVGHGETVISLAGAEARADLGEGRFVRVFGTVSLDRLVELARQLEPRQGGQITPLEPDS